MMNNKNHRQQQQQQQQGSVQLAIQARMNALMDVGNGRQPPPSQQQQQQKNAAARVQDAPLYVNAQRRFDNDAAGPPLVYVREAAQRDHEEILAQTLEQAQVLGTRVVQAEEEAEILNARARQAENRLQQVQSRLNVLSSQLQHEQTQGQRARAEADALRAEANALRAQLLQQQQQQPPHQAQPAPQVMPALSPRQEQPPAAAVANDDAADMPPKRVKLSLLLWRLWQVLQISYTAWRVCTAYTGETSMEDVAVDVVSALLFTLPLRWSLGALAVVLVCTCPLAPAGLRSRAAAPLQARVDYYRDITSNTSDWIWTEDAEHYFGNHSATFVLRASRSFLFDVDEYLGNDAEDKPTCFHMNRLNARYNTHPTCSVQKTLCYALFERVGICIPRDRVRPCTFCFPEPSKFVYPDNPWRFAFDEWMKQEAQKCERASQQQQHHSGNHTDGLGHQQQKKEEVEKNTNSVPPPSSSSSSSYLVTWGIFALNGAAISAALTFDVVRQRVTKILF